MRQRRRPNPRSAEQLRCEGLERRDAPAIVPVGPEFQINVTSLGSLVEPAVAIAANGDFVAVWQGDGYDGSNNAIIGRCYDRNGAPKGSEFQVNTFAFGSQQHPAVASDATGNFVVVWGSASSQDGSREGVFARRFSAAGVPLSGEFLVNTFTLNIQARPAIAMDGAGDFAIAWESNYQDGDGYGIFARRFNAAGVAQTGEVGVNAITAGDQRYPSVGIDNSDQFVVAWQTADASLEGVAARRFDAAGNPLGGEFAVNTQTTDEQSHPAVAMDPTGDFTVAWQSQQQDGAGFGIFARRYDSAGIAQANEFRVNSFTTGDQKAPRISSDAGGEMAVTWQSALEDGNGVGIFGQRLGSGGQLLNSEFQVNSTTVGDQITPNLASNAYGEFVVVWKSDGIFGQRFLKPPVPRANLTVDDGSGQRSGIRTLTLTFNTLMNLAPGSVTLSGPAGDVTLSPDANSLSTYNHTVVHYALSGAGVTAAGLIDGNYTLTVHSNLALNYDGEAYDGDGNGTPGPDGILAFHRLFGDINGDRTITQYDFNAFRNSFGLSAGQLGFLICVDFNGDGAIDQQDFIEFRNRFNFTIAP